MAHIPINHPLRPIYRTLAGLMGVYVLAFGIVGVLRSHDQGFFERSTTYALGLRTNMAFAVLSVIVGAIVVLGAFIGRNIDHFINLVAGLVFLVAGMVMLALLNTELNLLNFHVATCTVSFVIGLVLFTAGLYGKVSGRGEAVAEERFRHGGRDPVDHKWAFHGAPNRPAENDPDVHRFA